MSPLRFRGDSGTFYFSAVSSDWTVPSNDDLWRDGIKTLFDPCPPGWRVPGSGEEAANPWHALQAADAPWNDAEYGRTWNTSYLYGGSVHYSATGYRSYVSGMLDGVRALAHYQSSKGIDGIMVYVFYFVKSTLIVDRRAHRTHGLSVRCIRE